MKKRVFKRKIYNAIGEWKRKSNGQTALLIEGARRIGKSTIVEKFAKEEYRSYIVCSKVNFPHFRFEKGTT